MKRRMIFCFDPHDITPRSTLPIHRGMHPFSQFLVIHEYPLSVFVHKQRLTAQCERFLRRSHRAPVEPVEQIVIINPRHREAIVLPCDVLDDFFQMLVLRGMQDNLRFQLQRQVQQFEQRDAVELNTLPHLNALRGLI